jgi:outer membrane protein assembly factor BamB
MLVAQLKAGCVANFAGIGWCDGGKSCYGSHEFYAFSAKTGEVVWKISTSDDGPTAAVVDAGYVAFNTESCTVIVVEEKTGKIVWQEWLFDSSAHGRKDVVDLPEN